MKTDINCAVVLDLLPLYHDNVVSDKTKEIVSQHLEECESCKKEYQLICKHLPNEVSVDTKNLFAQMIKKQRNRKILFNVLVFITLFSIWFFSHSLTAEQALEKDSYFTDIIASYNVNGDEVFFVKNDSQVFSTIIEKNGLFYNSKNICANFLIEKEPDLRANFSTSYDEHTEITTAMVIAWDDVEYVKYQNDFLDKKEYDDYTLFYGYGLEYIDVRPTLYDKDFNELEYYNNQE